MAIRYEIVCLTSSVILEKGICTKKPRQCGLVTSVTTPIPPTEVECVIYPENYVGG